MRIHLTSGNLAPPTSVDFIIAMIDRYDYGATPPAPRIAIPLHLIDKSRAQPGEAARSRGYLPFMPDGDPDNPPDQTDPLGPRPSHFSS